ncbi:Kinetochore-associated protein NNF1 [Colletotrichum siamense]|uniref:Kinetochore-associated protein NNF1 n=1 Tax=Colletotrichum siamense TaxID=690259 RepID=A0A9P5F5A1_COLSI|nr:Kinetochore-associated protein NNF1 [Colletotrichum siamense]KAF4867215.1 Kinetochore-associated protein NNF1 [Colletotrichum siamense]
MSAQDNSPPQPPPDDEAQQQPEQQQQIKTSQSQEDQQQQQQIQDQDQQQQQQNEDQQQQPPASPPLPQKHTAVTPGVRAGYFIKTYDRALQKTLETVRYDNFASCFPTIAAHAPNTLRNVQKQMVDYLEERCNKDFQSILGDRDVVKKLNELESLVSDAERRRQESNNNAGDDVEEPIPPHLLPPDDVITAHLAPRLASQQSHLNARLQNTQASNESLFAAIQSQRAEIEALLAQLEGHVADIDGANAMLGDVAPELASEARDAEAQMSGM